MLAGSWNRVLNPGTQVGARWIDRHADCQLDTCPSGSNSGAWLHVLCGGEVVGVDSLAAAAAFVLVLREAFSLVLPTGMLVCFPKSPCIRFQNFCSCTSFVRVFVQCGCSVSSSASPGF